MASNSKIVSEKNEVSDIVFRGISSAINGSWSGTMSDLMIVLNKTVSKKEKVLLPQSPSALRVVINKVINRLRNKGISVKFVRTADYDRTRLVKFAR